MLQTWRAATDGNAWQERRCKGSLGQSMRATLACNPPQTHLGRVSFGRRPSLRWALSIAMGSSYSTYVSTLQVPEVAPPIVFVNLLRARAAIRFAAIPAASGCCVNSCACLRSTALHIPEQAVLHSLCGTTCLALSNNTKTAHNTARQSKTHKIKEKIM